MQTSQDFQISQWEQAHESRKLTERVRWFFILFICLLMLLGLGSLGHAYTLDTWADCIKITEGPIYPYGIKQYGHISPFKARIICKRTIWHKWQDYRKTTLKTPTLIDFLGYLADRYCPYSVDPQGNLNWKHNLPIILREEL